MEIDIPIHVPDLTIRKLMVIELEGIFVMMNNAHAQCLEGNPTQIFSEDPEEEKKLLEEVIRSLDLIHGWMNRELIRHITDTKPNDYSLGV